MKITDSDEFRQLFYDFRKFAIDVNDFAQNIYMVFRKNNLRNVWLGNIGYIVDRLTSIQNFVKENTRWSLEYKDCIETVQIKYKSYKRRIKKDLNKFKKMVVYTESGNSYLVDEFEYIDSVIKQNIKLLKKWEYLNNKGIWQVEGSEGTIMNDEEAIYYCDDFKVRGCNKS